MMSDLPLPARLGRFLRRVRVLTAVPAGTHYQRLPDGEVEVLVRPDHGASVVGPRLSALHKPSSEAGDAILVRFRPGGAYPFFGGRLAELADEVAPLDDRWVTRDIVGLLCRLLESRRADPARAVVRALALVEAATRLPTVAALAAAVGTSERQLRRLFAQVVGTSPKAYLRAQRFRRVRGAARSGRPWAELAEEVGYCDQAHLIGDFRALAGVTPEVWLDSYVRSRYIAT